MNVDRIRAIYEEIGKYTITLHSDPRSLGPLYLQNIISETRNYLNAVGRIQLEVHRERQDVSRNLRAFETAYDVRFAEILSQDERVARLPSIEDRTKTVQFMLREDLNRVAALKAELQDLDFVEKAVKYQHRELTSTMTEIKLQRSLIRDEMESGAMYGDERKGNHERGPGPLGADVPDIDEAELGQLLEEASSSASEAPVEPVVEAPAVEPPVVAAVAAPEASEEGEAAVHRFLDEGRLTAKLAPVRLEENYDDVFDNL